MTRADYQIFYLALAYVATYVKPSDNPAQAEPAYILARHIEEYCRKNATNAFRPVEIVFASEGDSAELDQQIDWHIRQLKTAEETVLPQDKETLLKFYDRLQQRKSRRMQSVFYETVNTEMLANAVLKYLDEEIEDTGAA